MIECKFQNPKAFNNTWRPIPRYRQGHYDFTRFMYRIFNVEYSRDNDEFRNALEQIDIMENLTR